MSNKLVYVRADTGPAYWGPGDRYTFLITGDESGGSYFTMGAWVPPGGGPPPHIHHREEEQFYLLEGQLTVQEWHIRNRLTFPDVHYIIDDMFATDDRVALRWTATATHRGALWNIIPPTGKTITWNGMHLLRLANRQIVEVWAVQNSIAQLQQMGVRLQPAADDAEGNNTER